ncbi:MAG: hypothetical protein MSS92_05455 [Lachnospiraceae bacterium]|nr:hypothetical protein [Lachnospiraceae bacterium]MDY4095599.1 hypothetical protein [Lachnospiraceae bacterium]
MSIVILCVIILAIGFIKEAISQIAPYYGTSRDYFKDNPNFVESRRRAQEIYDKQCKEYEKRTGKKVNW